MPRGAELLRHITPNAGFCCTSFLAAGKHLRRSNVRAPVSRLQRYRRKREPSILATRANEWPYVACRAAAVEHEVADGAERAIRCSGLRMVALCAVRTMGIATGVSIFARFAFFARGLARNCRYRASGAIKASNGADHRYISPRGAVCARR